MIGVPHVGLGYGAIANCFIAKLPRLLPLNVCRLNTGIGSWFSQIHNKKLTSHSSLGSLLLAASQPRQLLHGPMVLDTWRRRRASKPSSSFHAIIPSEITCPLTRTRMRGFGRGKLTPDRWMNLMGMTGRGDGMRYPKTGTATAQPCEFVVSRNGARCADMNLN